MYLLEGIGVALSIGLLTAAIEELIHTKSEDPKRRAKILLLVACIVALLTLCTYLFISMWNSPYRIQILPTLIFIIAIAGFIYAFKTIKQKTKLFIAATICLVIIVFGVFWFAINYSTLQQSTSDTGIQGTEIPEAETSIQAATTTPPADLLPTQPTPEPTEILTLTPSPSITPSPSGTPTQTSTNTPTPSVVLPFLDSFDPKPRPEWDFFRGEWHGFEGHLTGQLNLNERQIALVGDKNWRNYRIGVECYSYDFIYPVLIILRASHENYIMLRFSQLQGLDWVAFDQGKETLIAHKKMTFPRRFETTYMFKVEVQDDILTAFVDEEQVSQVQIPEPMMDRFSTGMVGVGYEPAGHLVWFDDYKVEEVP